ncbi:MAG: hypothetical protein JW804_05230 [Sedimentisphaerales bacterium]|nr:hypothetical protein [Sedimentisphaerales bacterium]
MPKFCIIGEGRNSNRKRKRIYQAFDKATAVAMAESEETIVEQVSQLQNPSASPEQIAYAQSLGLTLPKDADRIDVVMSILLVLADEKHKVRAVYLTDINNEPWSPIIEPYKFQRSKEGIRLRCWVYEPKPVPDVVADYQTEGWHLYLVDDIESVVDTGESFIPREYNGSTTKELIVRIGAEGPDIQW